MHMRHISSTGSFATTDTNQPSGQHLLLSLVTWLIALALTVISITLRLVLRLLFAVTSLSFRWLFYIVLGAVLACTVAVLAVLSIITLGAVSLP